MGRFFNVSAVCKPDRHYMVNLDSRLAEIKRMVDQGQYFTINRARQYGKTTLLAALGEYLKDDYLVVSLDFQMVSGAKFRDENTFSTTFGKMFINEIEGTAPDSIPVLETIKKEIKENRDDIELPELFEYVSRICKGSKKPVVLIIDEVDSAADNQVFMDFLGQLRGYYIRRDEKPIFRSVILAGVYDIKNMKRKIRPDDQHKVNSPWNIAADFLIDMSFSQQDIAGMLESYESDTQTGMDIDEISGEIYEYTSGYPFLVSRLCKLIDERIAGSEEFPDKKRAWTQAGFLAAVRILLLEKNTLFESLTGKLTDYPELKEILYRLLFQGQAIMYSPDDSAVDAGLMFGFVKVNGEKVEVANRIFEMRLYNLFLTLPQMQNTDIYRAASRDASQFVKNGRLDMRLVLEKFVRHFDDIYGDQEQKFIEEDGRRYFLLYLKPIINGTGNYYIEARTRNQERTDIVVEYMGEQFVIETKIWRGNAYNARGEKQLSDYLEYYHLKKGYMLSFNFNKKKEIGVKEILLGDKILIEGVV